MNHPLNIVVLGHGMVGHKFLERLALDNAPHLSVTVLCEEPRPAYDRVHLSEFFAGKRAEDLSLVAPGFFEQTGFSLRLKARASAIDRRHKTVTTADGEVLAYDKLVLATGSVPFVPPVRGNDRPDCFVYRTIEDLEGMTECGARSQSGVVVGGGFIGLEAAVALADMWGVQVSVVEMMDQILPGVLSQPLSRMAANDCQTHKVDVFTSEKVLRLEGENGTVTKVVTDKREISAQLVIFAAGFIPNGQLAKDAGLEVAPFGAVVVDEHMRTTDPSIYAGGDCVAIKNIITDKIGYIQYILSLICVSQYADVFFFLYSQDFILHFSNRHCLSLS